MPLWTLSRLLLIIAELLLRRIIMRSRDFTKLSQKRKFIFYDISISKIVQVDRASNADYYGIFLLLLWFRVNQTKNKILGKVKNIKDSFIPSIYIN